MTIEEEKIRAKAEKEHLAMLIAIHQSGNRYSLGQLRGMKLKKLREIAAELHL